MRNSARSRPPIDPLSANSFLPVNYAYLALRISTPAKMSHVARKTFMKNWYAVEVCGIFLLALVPVLIRSGIECLTFEHRPSRCESSRSSRLLSPVRARREEEESVGQVDEGFVVKMRLADDSSSYTIIGGVVAGAGWYLYRLARGPEGRHLYLSWSRSFGSTPDVPSVLLVIQSCGRGPTPRHVTPSSKTRTSRCGLLATSSRVEGPFLANDYNACTDHLTVSLVRFHSWKRPGW